MTEKIEKIYSSEQERKEEVPESIKIPEEYWRTLEIIAKRVGSDFGMEAKLGPLFLGEFNPLAGEKRKFPKVLLKT